MKINQIIQETTTAGSIAPTEHAFVKMQTRNPSVYGDQKVGSLFKGKKTSKPFVNSLNEGAVKQLSMDLKELKDEEFKKKYKMTKQEARKNLTTKPEKVNEAHLEEDDIIVVPGQGRLKKTGFVKHDPDKAEHEGQTLKNSLHTIIRVATHLDKELSVKDNFPEWVSEKVGTVKSMMVTVMDYLISAKEMQHDPDAMEGQLDELSKGTINNYINQAIDDVSDRSHNTGVQKGARVAGQALAGGKGDAGRFEKDAKIAKRKVGISRAVSKLGK